MTPQDFFKNDLFAENTGVVQPTRTVHWLSLSRPASLFYAQADLATLFLPKHANATSVEVQAVIR